ncbi:NUDIX domain-containing protein [Celerinatantimonas sp. YJH-8]|uniref:NUDIX domain-containing protein n=1 Tax=Celerinatantimonas sp. YJH-8 TaxID=3228714 RepID=UPI0038C3C95E
MLKEIETLASRVVYSNRWMQVREDHIRRDSGHEGIYGVVDKPDFAVILPIQEGHIYLVEQYRYPVGGRYWELPQGSWEQQPDADPLMLAAGELKEETGLVAGCMQYVGSQFLAYGYSSQRYHIYLATDLTQREPQLDEEEQGLVAQRFTLQAFETMLRSGDIQDATTANAYGLAKLKGFLSPQK